MFAETFSPALSSRNKIHTKIHVVSYHKMAQKVPNIHSSIARLWWVQGQRSLLQVSRGKILSNRIRIFCILNEHFAETVTALDYRKHYVSGTDWPACSPDLNPCDFFLRGYLKDRVYQTYPKTLEELKFLTEHQISNISTKVLHSVVSNFGIGC
jgi:hypothetical protein